MGVDSGDGPLRPVECCGQSGGVAHGAAEDKAPGVRSRWRATVRVSARWSMSAVIAGAVVLGSTEKRREALLELQQSGGGARLRGFAEVSPAAVVSTTGGVGPGDVAGEGLGRLDLLEQRPLALPSVAAGTRCAEEDGVGGAGELPRETPGCLPSAIGGGQAGGAEPAPAHRPGHPFQPAGREPSVDLVAIAGQWPPHVLDLHGGEPGGGGQTGHLVDTVAEGDVGGRLTPEPASGPQARGQVGDGGLEPGGVGGQPGCRAARRAGAGAGWAGPWGSEMGVWSRAA